MHGHFTLSKRRLARFKNDFVVSSTAIEGSNRADTPIIIIGGDGI